MRFRIIQGGKSVTPDIIPPLVAVAKTPSTIVQAAVHPVHADHGPSPADVRFEARRRRLQCGAESARNREAITGRPVPTKLHRHALEIDFVAQKLASLRPIPEDFKSDKYWPAMIEVPS